MSKRALSYIHCVCVSPLPRLLLVCVLGALKDMEQQPKWIQELDDRERNLLLSKVSTIDLAVD